MCTGWINRKDFAYQCDFDLDYVVQNNGQSPCWLVVMHHYDKLWANMVKKCGRYGVFLFVSVSVF